MVETNQVFGIIAIIIGCFLVYIFGVRSFEALVNMASAVEIFKNLLLFVIGAVAIGIGIKSLMS